MAILSRYVCIADGEIPSTAKTLLKSFSEHQERECITKIEDVKDIEYNNQRFITGTIHHKREEKIPTFRINAGNVLEEVQSIKKAYSVVFFINPRNQLIIFTNSIRGEMFGKKILSKALFNMEDKVIPNVFNIPALEQAVREGTFSNIWLHNYKRSGNITNRQESGENIELDVEYKTCSQVDKTRLGIEMGFGGYTGKVIVHKDGAIIFYKDWDNPGQNINNTFALVKKLLPYSISPITL
jgi:hypothetical protein